MKNHSLDKPNPTSRLNATPRPEAVPGAGGISRWVQRLPGAGWLSHFLARRGPNTALASGAATDRAGDLHTSESGFPPSGPFIAGDVPPSEKELAERLLKYVRSRKNAHDGWILFDHLDHATKVNRMFFSLFGLKGLCCTNRIADGMTPTPDGAMPQQPPARFEDGRSG